MKKIIFRGKAITMIQPWASAIAFAGKDIENRSWNTHYRGPIAIHAGAKFDRSDLEYTISLKTKAGRRTKSIDEWIELGQKRWGLTAEERGIPTSCVIAIGMLTDCLESSSSPWHNDESYGLKIEAVIPIVPVPMKGDLMLWNCKFQYQPLDRG